jgi:disulfide bond formation protein DsbB
MPNVRLVCLAGFLAAAGLMGAALFFQYVQNLAPCPLCIVQRWFVIAVGLVLLAGAVHDPRGWVRRAYGAVTVLFAGLGAAVAARHVWIQNLPPEKQPGCGLDLDSMLAMFPLLKTATLVWAGTSDCAAVTWRFLGLSMPAWVLVAFAGFIVLGLVLIFVRSPSRA